MTQNRVGGEGIMTTTATQDRDFIDNVITQCLLEKSIDWIHVNLSPEEVFSTTTLGAWAEDNGYVEKE